MKTQNEILIHTHQTATDFAHDLVLTNGKVGRVVATLGCQQDTDGELATLARTIASRYNEAESLRAENEKLRAALEKIDSNAAESVEWIRRVAREALAGKGAE